MLDCRRGRSARSMANLTMRRIHHAAADAVAELERLRQQLSLQADVVSPRGRQLTEQVFGEPLTPAQVVERICADVRARGLPAVLHYTEKLDRVQLTAETVRVSPAELQQAHAQAAPEFLATIRRVRHNVLSFQMGLLHADATLTSVGRHELRLRYRPVRR